MVSIAGNISSSLPVLWHPSAVCTLRSASLHPTPVEPTAAYGQSAQHWQRQPEHSPSSSTAAAKTSLLSGQAHEWMASASLPHQAWQHAARQCLPDQEIPSAVYWQQLSDGEPPGAVFAESAACGCEPQCLIPSIGRHCLQTNGRPC